MKKAVLIIVFLFMGLLGFCQNLRHYIIRYQTQGDIIYHNTQSVSGIHIDTLGQELIHNNGTEWSFLADMDTIYIYNLTLITQHVTNITQTTATGGGSIVATDYVDVTERGICWNTDGMPTLDDNHASDGSGIGIFNCNMTGLSANTTYYVRAYVQLGNEYIYGNETSFTTEPLPSYTVAVSSNPSEGGMVTGGGTYEQGQSCMVLATANSGYNFINWTENGTQVSTSANYTFTVNSNRTLVANFVSSNDNHDYVDLGLPSGLLWATCNVGANTPEEYGDYFAWGETQPKSAYNWSTYQYCMDGNNTMLTKYCNDASYGYNGFTDNLTTLLPEDDAAAANWGGGWRMPTIEEWQELVQNTTLTWVTVNNVNGRLFTASNGNSLFLPAAGYHYGSDLELADRYGLYWSSSLYMVYIIGAQNFYFNSDGYLLFNFGRCCGQSVRPVRPAP